MVPNSTQQQKKAKRSGGDCKDPAKTLNLPESENPKIPKAFGIYFGQHYIHRWGTLFFLRLGEEFNPRKGYGLQ